MPKMSTREVRAIVEAEKTDALAAMQASTLSEERARALDYFVGDMDDDLPVPVDRSAAVSSDVADTIEGLMPSLIEIFASGDDVLQFDPVGIEDEEAAQQETDYVNHVFWHKNHGFMILYSLVKDALLQKNGIAKVWWEKREDEDRETYYDLPPDAFALLKAEVDKPDSGLEIVEQTEKDYQEASLDGMPMMPPVTHYDVTVARRKEYGCVKIEPIPPEEFGISRRARSVHISEADYCFHEVLRTESDLIGDGFDPEQVRSLPTAGFLGSEEEIARDTVDETGSEDNAGLNKATRSIRVTEHYVKLDYEGDGEARLYRVTTGGDNNVVLERAGKADIEPVDFMPFVAMTPVPVTHRFFGRSVADLVMDIQRIKTALLRAILDNAYLANNQRIEIAEDYAHERTLDDLLTNRPGGIVRTKRPGGLNVIPNQEIGSFVYPMLEYQDSIREWRTGVTKQGQGIDAKALADQSATAAMQLFTMAQARMRLIARIFAETGIRDLFLLIHATIRKHGREQQETVRLRNKWVPIDPRGWKTRNDMTVDIGIASGGKEQQLVFLTTLLGYQKEAIAVPQLGLIKPGNVYNTLKKLCVLAGLKSAEPYFTDPDEKDEEGNFLNRGEAQPDPKMEEAKARIQLEQEKSMAQAKLDQQKAEADLLLRREQLQAEMALKREQIAAEMQLKREQLQAELALKRELGLIGEAHKASVAASSVHVGGQPG